MVWSRLSGTAGPFRLTRWFFILGFFAIIGSSAVSAWLLSAFLKATWLHQDALITQQFVTSIVRARQAEQHFAAGDPNIAEGALEGLFAEIALAPHVFRANFFGLNSVVLWSSDDVFIGSTFESNPDLERALEGHLVVEEGVIGEVRKAEHAFLPGPTQPFIEYYIPISLESGETVGVIELYRSPEPVLQAIEHSRSLVWTSALIAGLVIYLLLGWLVRRADIIIRNQTRELSDNQAMAAIGEVSSAVAHGLRNPLASIRTSAELALESELPNDTRAVFRNIVGLSDRLENWIRDLLNSLRLDWLEYELCDVRHLVRDTLVDYEQEARRQSVEIAIDQPGELPLVRGNTIALRQVIGCLVANALEAMIDGGRLQIAMSSQPAAKRVAIAVSDTGDGPAADRDPFDAFVTTKGSGLGVGLALARRIVERHGGSLDLSRSATSGAVATILLPVEE